MTEALISQAFVKKALERLQKNKSEASNIDAKETLTLKEHGDCAVFIRHIAAFANTGQDSYLLIGIEDKTWIEKGIPEGSPLRKVDETKQQMNQILRTKLDPFVQVDYRVFEINGKAIGVVGVKGTNPPYIISIPEPKYGGVKTKGEDSYIYKGVIYIRSGTDSVSISRQSELLNILNGRRDNGEIVFSLVLIAVIISVGIGLGTSLIQFVDTIVPAILGCVFGMIIGGVFNKRLTDSFGRFPLGWSGKIIKYGGVLWGGFIGGFLSYIIVDKIISGKVQMQNPILMGLLLSPILAVLWMFAIVPYFFWVPDVIKFLRHKIFGK